MHVNAPVTKIGDGPIERRERRPVSMRAYALREDGSTEEVQLLDLSYEGCGIQAPCTFEVGEPIKLSVVRLGVIEARVQWLSGNRAGLVFAPQPKVKPKQQWPRRHRRSPLTVEVSMRRRGKINYRVRVFDASPDGCKVEIVERPRVEEQMLVKFEGLEALEAEVCWVDATTAGLKFTKSIHPAVFDLLVERLK